MADTQNEHVVKITADISDFERQTQDAQKDLDDLDKSADKSTSEFSKMGKAISEASETKGFSKLGNEIWSVFTRGEKSVSDFADRIRGISKSDPMKDMGSELSGISDKTADATRSVSDYAKQMDDARKSVSGLEDELSRVSAQKVPTESYKELSEATEKATNELFSLYDARERMQDTGVWDANSAKAREMESEMARLETELDGMEADLKGMEDSGAAFEVTDNGSISRIGTVIDSVKQHITDMAAKLAAIPASFNKASDEAEIYEHQLDLAQRTVKNLESEIERLSTQKVPTSDYAELTKEAEKSEAALLRLYNRREKLQDTGAWKENSKQAKSLEYDIKTLETQLEHTERNLRNMEEAGEAFEIPDNSDKIAKLNVELDKAKQKLANVESQAKSAGAAVSSMGSSGGSGLAGFATTALSFINPILGGITKIASSVWGAIKSLASAALNVLQSLASAVLNIVKSIASSLWSAVKGVASTIGSIFNKVVVDNAKKFAKWIAEGAKNFLGFNKQAKSGEGLIQKLQSAWSSFTRILKSQVMRAAVRAILSDVEDVLGHIAQISVDFNSAMSSMIDSSKRLGAQLVGIFEPVINAAAPFINGLMDMLSGVADTVAQFVARATGNDYYIQATKGQSDYAASLDDTAESTKKADKAAQEYQNTVLGFDQLNKMNGTNITGTDEDASVLGIDDAKVAKAKTQATEINKIADDINKAFKQGDYWEAGYKAGDAVKYFLDRLNDFAGWSKNSAGITAAMRNITEAVNGFIASFRNNASAMGKGIGDDINSIINAIYMLTDPVSGIDFYGLGESVGKFLVGMFNELDWEKAGADIIRGMQGLVRTINGALDQNIGKSLGKGLADAIRGISEDMDADVWSDLVSGLFNNFFDFIIGVFGDPESFGMIGKKLGTALAQSLEKTDWTKLWNAATALFKSLTQFISQFISGLAEGFDVEEDEIWETIGAGIVNAIMSVMEWVDQNILQSDIGTKLGEAISGIFTGAVGAVDPETIGSFFTDLVTQIGNLFSAAFDDTESFYEAGKKLGDLIVEILTVGDDAEDETGEKNKGVLQRVWDALWAFWHGLDDSNAIAVVGEKVRKAIDAGIRFLTSDTFKDAVSQLGSALCDALKDFLGVDEDESLRDYLVGTISDLISDVMWEIGRTMPNWFQVLFDVDSEEEHAAKKAETQYERALSKAEQARAEADAATAAFERGDQRGGGISEEEMLEEQLKAAELERDLAQTYQDIMDSGASIYYTEKKTGRNFRTDETAGIVWNPNDAKIYIDEEVLSLAEAEEKYQDALKKYNEAIGEETDDTVDVSNEVAAEMESAGRSMAGGSAGMYGQISLAAATAEDGGAEFSESADSLCDDIDSAADKVSSISAKDSNLLNASVGTLTDAYTDGIEQSRTMAAELSDTMEHPFDDTFDDSGIREPFETEQGAIDEETGETVRTMDESGRAMADKSASVFNSSNNSIITGFGGVHNTLGRESAALLADSTASDAIKEFFNKLLKTISGWATSLIDGVKGIFNGGKSIISGITGALFGGRTLTYSVVPQLANGGTLKDGQLFIANERGAEMIGTDNGKTVVSNNQQIVEAVTEGVKEAVEEALLTTGGNNDSGDTEIILRVDSEELARATIRGEKKLGKRTNMAVAFA